MAKKKNPLKQPTKAKIVDAIMGLEQGTDYCLRKMKQIEDVLIKYVQFKEDDVKFQEYLTEIDKKIQENIENASKDPKNEE
tara:strand:+ start:87 stop:329 length:243 start_codon:yes stop_codon:yes gene_type:complete